MLNGEIEAVGDRLLVLAVEDELPVAAPLNGRRCCPLGSDNYTVIQMTLARPASTSALAMTP